MLTDILQLLKARGPMSLAEIARHFRSEVSAIEGMLEVLKSKGRIERLDTPCSNCKGCVDVRPEDTALFKVL